ncbi:MAG: hypothetical protein KBS77_00700 [Bacteroidales bacterium]|nr:hypothetical protein [Candidatus Colicola faecequi]
MEILKYILPALVVLLATWIVLYKMLKSEHEKREWVLRKESRKEVIPIRLRGYERLALLLERTTPEHMLRDMDVPALTVQQLQLLLMKTIRMEFDHNLSQQIYVSDTTWEAILLVEEEMISFVCAGAANFKPDEPALPYAQQLITVYKTNGQTPVEKAQLMLRAEAREILK